MKEFEIKQICEYSIVIEAESKEEALEKWDDMDFTDMEEAWSSPQVQECL